MTIVIFTDVASWREGGGRAVPQPKPEEPAGNTSNSTPTETQTNGPQMSGGNGGQGGDGPSQPMPARQGSGHGPVQMGPPMGMPPQYRGMLPPFVSIMIFIFKSW